MKTISKNFSRLLVILLISVVSGCTYFDIYFVPSDSDDIRELWINACELETVKNFTVSFVNEDTNNSDKRVCRNKNIKLSENDAVEANKTAKAIFKVVCQSDMMIEAYITTTGKNGFVKTCKR